MPLDDVEPMRGEDGDEEGYITATPRAKSKGTNDILICFDCWCTQPALPLYIYSGRFGLVPRRSTIESAGLDGLNMHGKRD